MNPDSKHFSPEQWADFVRQITPDRERALMQAHLETGCEHCNKTVQWLQTVVETVGAVPTWQDPPYPLVQRAKQAFRPVRPSQNWMEQLETLVANLVLVSTGDWLPQGVRSGSAAGERLLYRAGAYSIDLTMDQGAALGEPGEIIGQIVDEQDDEGSALDCVLVQLCAGDKVLGETETNQFGEFVLQRPKNKAARLRFAITGHGKKIELHLKSGKEQTRE